MCALVSDALAGFYGYTFKTNTVMTRETSQPGVWLPACRLPLGVTVLSTFRLQASPKLSCSRTAGHLKNIMQQIYSKYIFLG